MRLQLKTLKNIILVCLLLPLFSANAFIVKHIEVQGARRMSPAAVRALVPVHLGQNIHSIGTGHIIQKLYQSGYFSNVSLGRRGHNLVVSVQERPTIGLLSLSGNSAITNKQLKPILKKLQIIEGEVYSPEKLNEFKLGLEQGYQNLGYYAANIDIKVKTEPRNRVAVSITVNEGPIAIVKSIRVLGSKAFSESNLVDKMKLSTSGIFSFLSHSDRYSPMRLAQDQQTIKNFYLDHGYLLFKFTNKKVTVSTDHKSVTIVLTVSEGPVFHIGSVKVVGQEANNPAVNSLVNIKSGQVFSRANIMAVDNAIAAHFRNQGHALVSVQVATKLNKAQRSINLSFNVRPGKQIYVRYIHFIGNHKNHDFVLRSRLLQLEGSLYSQKMIDESKRRLSVLPYFTNVNVTTTPVPNHPGLVDLTYTVTERDSGNFQIQGGYMDVEGFFYGVSVFEQSFMGTGKALGLTFQHSELSANYSISYTNPMYTLSGISRSLSVSYSHSKPSNVGLANYEMKNIKLGVNYGIPTSINNRINLGFSYSNMSISNYQSATASPNIVNFLNRYPSPFNQLELNLGWSRDTTDRFPFPMAGGHQTLGLSVGVPMQFGTKTGNHYGFTSLGYYKITYNGRWYFPLSHGFVVNPHVTLGYGSGLGAFNQLPFFDNFYGGGSLTLPGFQNNSLGPRNPNDASESLGGNVQILGGLNFVFPNFISDNVRTAVFLDAGNIFETQHVAGVEYEKIALSNIRASTGLLLGWNVPMLGPLEFTVGFPINKKPGDSTSWFGFTFGANL